MRKIWHCFHVFFIYLVVSMGAGYYSWTNPAFQYTAYEGKLTYKWTEWWGKKSRQHEVLLGRFEGTDKEGNPFKYEVKIGDYTYKHVPLGTNHTFTVRPYDLTRHGPTLITQAIVSAVAMVGTILTLCFFFTGLNRYRKMRWRRWKN